MADGSPTPTRRAATPRTRRLDLAAAGPAPEDLLRTALREAHPGATALVSSFGADSAVLLHMVARIDRTTPVLFLETGMLFPETLAYQRDLAADLGLTDVRLIRPEPADLAAADPDGTLNARDADGCCALRKTRPLDRALAGFEAWITGRRRAQARTRAGMARVEEEPGTGRVKLNPLADWGAADIRAYMDAHALPRHPLVARGYPSIGCAPCTSPVTEGEDPRAGRWRGREKTECGIHFDGTGRVRRAPSDPSDRLSG